MARAGDRLRARLGRLAARSLAVEARIGRLMSLRVDLEEQQADCLRKLATAVPQ